MGSKDLNVFKRDTLTIGLSIKDNVGSPVDITGYTFFFTVKTSDSIPDSGATIQKDVTSHTTPASGISAIICSSSDTDVATGRYYYDIQMKDTGSAISTLCKGFITFEQDVTVRTS
jgi:hypothetical protein